MPILQQQNRPQNQAGSGFTNLQRYLQANKSNRLGQAVAGGVQQAGQQAQGAITQAGQQFETESEKEKERLASQGKRVSDILGGDVSKASDEDVGAFQNILGAESKGPTGVQNAEELRSKAQEAQQLGQAGGSQAGRFGLLQRFVGGNRPYTMGQQRLDQLLLGQTGSQQLQGARAGTIGLGQQAERQIGAAQAQGQELQGQARQLAESTKGQLGQQASAYDTAMQQKLAEQTKAYQDVINQFGPQAMGNAPVQIDENMFKQLTDVSGGLLGEGTGLYKSDITPYLGINKIYATKQAAQSAEDLARAQALQKLGGNFLAGTDAASTLGAYTAQPELAGQFAQHGFDVTSQSDLNAALQKAKSDYESARQSTGSNIQSLENQLAGQGDRGTYTDPSYLSLLNAYAANQAYQTVSPLGLEPNQTAYNKALSEATPEWSRKLGLVQDIVGRPGAGAGFAGSSAHLAPLNFGGIDLNADFLKNAYSGLEPQIAAAKQWAMNQNDAHGQMARKILAEEQQLKAAQEKYGLLPGQFNVLRTLQKAPSVVKNPPPDIIS